MRVGLGERLELWRGGGYRQPCGGSRRRGGGNRGGFFGATAPGDPEAKMKSMTGYGEAAGQGKRAKITVQARTLNHRHLDLQLRVPREYLSIQQQIRKAIRQRISRRRV